MKRGLGKGLADIVRTPPERHDSQERETQTDFAIASSDVPRAEGAPLLDTLVSRYLTHRYVRITTIFRGRFVGKLISYGRNGAFRGALTLRPALEGETRLDALLNCDSPSAFYLPGDIWSEVRLVHEEEGNFEIQDTHPLGIFKDNIIGIRERRMAAGRGIDALYGDACAYRVGRLQAFGHSTGELSLNPSMRVDGETYRSLQRGELDYRGLFAGVRDGVLMNIANVALIDRIPDIG